MHLGHSVLLASSWDKNSLNDLFRMCSAFLGQLANEQLLRKELDQDSAEHCAHQALIGQEELGKAKLTD